MPPVHLRLVAGVLAAFATAVLAGGCGDDDGGAAPTTTASETTAPSTTADDATTTTATDPEPSGSVIDVEVAGGQPVGGVQRVTVPLGDDVTLRVTVADGDAPDEVHVHGYDRTVDTVPGDTVELTFVADIPGQFEIELEGSHELLVNLVVT